MTAIPDPKTWNDGDRPDWKEFGQEIFDTLDFLFNPPMCYVRPSSSLNLNNDEDTAVLFGEVLADMPGTQAMFKTAQPDRIIPKTAGRYLVSYAGMYADGACGCSGTRAAMPVKNGTILVGGNHRDRSGSSDTAFAMPGGLGLTVLMNGTTDYLQLVLRTTGGATSTGTGAATSVWYMNIHLSVRWVSYE